MNPPPPMLPAVGCVTASANAVATAASTAFPPRCRMLAPTSEAMADVDTTRPVADGTPAESLEGSDAVARVVDVVATELVCADVHAARYGAATRSAATTRARGIRIIGLSGRRAPAPADAVAPGNPNLRGYSGARPVPRLLPSQRDEGRVVEAVEVEAKLP